jgi:hypothetical protein
MNTSTTNRPMGTPAYYLGRPASQWLAATRPRDRFDALGELPREHRRAHPVVSDSRDAA